MKRNTYWLLWNSFMGKWQVTKTGKKIALENFETKQPAIDYGVAVAKNNKPSQLYIKRKDGTIQMERTYGYDPYPSIG